MDERFGALDQFRGEGLGDTAGDEIGVVDVGACADEFAERFAQAYEVPPDDGWLVAVGVAEGVVVVVRGIGGVKIVKEGEGTEVQAEADEGGIVCVEDAVCEGVGLPCGNGAGVATHDFAVESGETVFFGALSALDLGRGDRSRGNNIVRCGDYSGGVEGRGEGVPAWENFLGDVGGQLADQSSVAACAENVECAYSKPGLGEAGDDGTRFKTFAADTGCGGQGKGEGTGGGDVKGVEGCRR